MIILDTHIFLWSVSERFEKIPKEIFKKLDESETLGVCGISLWEVSMLVQKGRITLPCGVLEWFHKAFADPRMKLLPITPEIAAISGSLPMHGDPADRIIAATSVVLKCGLATVDREMCELGFLKIV